MNGYIINQLKDTPACPGVYMISDNLTGLKYIGSSVNLKWRVRNHFSPSGSTYFIASGFENCTVEIIEDCTDKSKHERLQLEYNHIIKHNTIWPNGLNKASPLNNLRFNLAQIQGGKRKKDKRAKATYNYLKEPKVSGNVMLRYLD